MSQSFGIPKLMAVTTKNQVDDETYSIALYELNLVLTCEQIPNTTTRVLVVRSLDGEPISVLPAASNTVAVMVGAR